MTNINMIRAAQQRIGKHVLQTPLLSSPFLNEIAGRDIWVKPECLQHTGSFKFRGGWAAISALSAQQCKDGVIAFSSGNHAQGVAIAAKHNNVPATIIMPSDAPTVKIENTRSYGATVVLYDRANEDRDVVAQNHNPEGKLTLIRPFDEPEVIAGQGTVGLEIAKQAKDMGINDAGVLVCCGGGGLTSGIALALEADAPDFRVHTCEPVDFDDVARSLKSGKHEVNARKSGSICDAIITPSPGKLTLPIMQRLCGEGFAVTEQDCLRAMALAYMHLHIVIEPGGAVALAAALFHNATLKNDTLIAVATGGNTDTEIFVKAISEYGDHP